MDEILRIAAEHGITVIEDVAQALSADYTFQIGKKVKAGTMGHMACTSFFPSKNLGCFGDGGAMMTNDAELAGTLSAITHHGMRKRYYYDLTGVNSRLDNIQAAILRVKLRIWMNILQPGIKPPNGTTSSWQASRGLTFPERSFHHPCFSPVYPQTEWN